MIEGTYNETGRSVPVETILDSPFGITNQLATLKDGIPRVDVS